MASVRKRGKTYLIRVSAGRDINGKQLEKTMTWIPPSEMTARQAEKEAKHQAELFEEKVRTGQVCNGRIRFIDYAELWFTNYAEPQLKPRTVARYRELLQRVNLAMGHMRLEQIFPTHLMEFYRSLESSIPKNARFCCTVDLRSLLKTNGFTQASFSSQFGVSSTTLSTAWHKKPISYRSVERICHGLGMNRDSIFKLTNPNKALSASTVKRYHSLIAKMLHDAVLWGYIPYNPADRVAPPKAAKPNISYLDDVQSKHLLELLRSQPGKYRRPAILLLLTGLRRGELMGLEWQDINFERKTIRICRTSQYLPDRGVYTDTTKNSTSNRTVKISDQVIRVLQEQYLWQQRQKKLLGDAWKKSNRVVTTDEGTPMRPDLLSAWFGGFIEETDLPDIHLHSLRHTYATLCIAKGVPLTAVAAQLGHANVATTSTIYAHAIESAQITATDTIGDLLGGSL